MHNMQGFGKEKMIPYKFAKFANKEAMELYIEFSNMPGNHLSFEVPRDVIITTEMMHTFANVANHVKHKEDMLS